MSLLLSSTLLRFTKQGLLRKLGIVQPLSCPFQLRGSFWERIAKMSTMSTMSMVDPKYKQYAEPEEEDPFEWVFKSDREKKAAVQKVIEHNKMVEKLMRAGGMPYCGQIERDIVVKERKFLRKAKFLAPKLKEHLIEFVPPTKKQYVKFQTYENIGKDNDIDIRCTMIIDLAELAKLEIFTPEQTHKLLLICHNRYFQLSNILRFSCSKYPSLKQNKLYLAKLWKTIVAEVKDPTDMFADIPITAVKPAPRRRDLLDKICIFPQEWIQANS